MLAQKREKKSHLFAGKRVFVSSGPFEGGKNFGSYDTFPSLVCTSIMLIFRTLITFGNGKNVVQEGRKKKGNEFYLVLGNR